jgi:hypothetical protein
MCALPAVLGRELDRLLLARTLAATASACLQGGKHVEWMASDEGLETGTTCHMHPTNMRAWRAVCWLPPPTPHPQRPPHLRASDPAFFSSANPSFRGMLPGTDAAGNSASHIQQHSGGVVSGWLCATSSVYKRSLHYPYRQLEAWL